MKPPLLLVGHGTRDEDGAADFGRFVERLSRRLPGDVAGGFIELSSPPLTEAVAGLYGRGHRHLAAVPMMLVAAGHGKGDIPGAMARELVRHPGLDYVYGRPLGPHPTLLALLEERLDAALGDADRAETAVLLVGRGSTDPDANAEICKVARLLWEGRGLRLVEPAFVSLAEPSVPQGLERCRLLLGAAGRSHGGETQRAAGRSHGGETQGAAGRSHGGETRPHRVVVLPYFLFPGVLPDRVLAQTQAYAAEHPELDVRGADVIGDCDGLADLVVERYEEAIEGDIRMNCDTCIYRIAMPGFENRVGVPQTPHQHPDDPSHGHAHAH